MMFLRPGGGRVLVADAARATLDRFRQVDGEAPEAGGVLLGRLVLNSEDIIVDEAAPPAPRDERKRFYFFRRRREAQDRVDAAWSGSVGTCIYLGEWHTHPESAPTPSPHDVSEWRRIAREARYDQSALIFIIQGTQSLAAWEVDRMTQTASRLHLPSALQ